MNKSNRHRRARSYDHNVGTDYGFCHECDNGNANANYLEIGGVMQAIDNVAAVAQNARGLVDGVMNQAQNLVGQIQGLSQASPALRQDIGGLSHQINQIAGAAGDTFKALGGAANSPSGQQAIGQLQTATNNLRNALGDVHQSLTNGQSGDAIKQSVDQVKKAINDTRNAVNGANGVANEMANNAQQAKTVKNGNGVAQVRKVNGDMHQRAQDMKRDLQPAKAKVNAAGEKVIPILALLRAEMAKAPNARAPAMVNGAKAPAMANGAKAPAMVNGAKAPAMVNGAKAPAMVNGAKAPAMVNEVATGPILEDLKQRNGKAPAVTKAEKKVEKKDDKKVDKVKKEADRKEMKDQKDEEKAIVKVEDEYEQQKKVWDNGKMKKDAEAYRDWKDEVDYKKYCNLRKFLDWHDMIGWKKLDDFPAYFMWKIRQHQNHKEDNALSREFKEWKSDFDFDDFFVQKKWKEWKKKKDGWKRQNYSLIPRQTRYGPSDYRKDTKYNLDKKHCSLKDYAKYRRYCNWADHCDQTGKNLLDMNRFKEWKVQNKRFHNPAKFEDDLNEYKLSYQNSDDWDDYKRWNEWKQWRKQKGCKDTMTEVDNSDNRRGSGRRDHGYGHKKHGKNNRQNEFDLASFGMSEFSMPDYEVERDRKLAKMKKEEDDQKAQKAQNGNARDFKNRDYDRADRVAPSNRPAQDRNYPARDERDVRAVAVVVARPQNNQRLCKRPGYSGHEACPDKCDDCSECSSCSDCSDCSDCSECSVCSECSSCPECSECSTFPECSECSSCDFPSCSVPSCSSCSACSSGCDRSRKQCNFNHSRKFDSCRSY